MQSGCGLANYRTCERCTKIVDSWDTIDREVYCLPCSADYRDGTRSLAYDRTVRAYNKIAQMSRGWGMPTASPEKDKGTNG